MDSIFNDNGPNTKPLWVASTQPLLKSGVCGRFFEEEAGELVRSRDYYVESQSIMFEEQGQVFRLELTFTVVEEKLYLRNHRKTFAIKLTRNGQTVELHTPDPETFTLFYSVISSLCLLTNFEEHYRVKDILGKGQFSVVYEGQHTFTHQIVALKKYSKSAMKEITGGVDVIKNEIRNLHDLKSYNISPLIQIFETIDAVVLVQHKAEGGDMTNFTTMLREHHHCDEAAVKRIIKNVLERVALLHAIGYVHRDLKPQNILFRSHQDFSPLYLSDLGLTVKKDQLTNRLSKHYSCGTLGFVAPEVLQFGQSGDMYDEACDIFSVGCIFFFLLTNGGFLFEGTTKRDLYLKNRDCVEVEERINQTQMDPKAHDLIEKMLEVNPEKRISAAVACRHDYFYGMTNPDPKQIIFEDTHQQNRQFLRRKISRYWASTTI